MEAPTLPEGLLSPYRVLDLTDERGYLCGKILGDLGAEVIKVEPPGGDPGRCQGPFYKGRVHPEESLYWFAYNLNKRGITLNLSTCDGRAILQRLVTRADLLIESFDPGYLDALGLSYRHLSQLNPGLVMISITAFGQAGPYASYKASDLVLMAMGGMMYISGDQDRPPVRISFPQAYLHASVEGAVGGLMALFARGSSGQGQHVDVSAQQCVVWTLMNVTTTWDLNRVNVTRSGATRVRSMVGTSFRLNWPCKDGYVTFTMQGGQVGGSGMRALIQWMEGDGLDVSPLKAVDWDTVQFNTITQQELDRVSTPIEKFFLSHTKEELFEGANQRDIILYPVSTPGDAYSNKQLLGRGFFQPVEHPELGASLLYPGAFVKLSEAPITFRRRAPRIGEHNEEVYAGELGIPKEELVLLRQNNVI